MNDIKIRAIQPKDNKVIASVIREVLIEMGVPKVGTAYEDKSLDSMHETYNYSRMKYYVVEEEGRIIGGAGIAPLEGEVVRDICELQKMYFLPQARGKGVGYAMINKCLDFAKEQGYAKCYLETMPYMESARKLYKKVGFIPLEEPIGDTGHYSCQAWMIKDL
ncbi:putative acetyltransferase [Aquimarina sp. EL_43]|uniref:GNAT family N-acetyltransferase n=1 Tax=Aquimarina TaxID=290174 RepID=UPI0004718CFF|nr:MULTISPECIES: GNAT family N-acetyltransferase [Aquimarina]MBG6132078.1 putative acetyltransferase [Aquimarina sp. EL_35]MBG6152875.1 putative acetyltransferase [Aquimarina sp. EL_32]MBG6170882.1 putative acetyltransferase [Aquimarina sp. EL_43]